MLELVAVCIALGAGLAGGWWLRGADPRYQRVRAQAADAARARDALERLRELTHNVASDVDKHKALMGRINKELSASDEGCTKSVLQAVDKLIQCNDRIQQQLDSAEDKLENQARQIDCRAAEAHTDPLTALANRRVFDKALNDAYRAFLDHNKPAVVMMLDVDHFKNLNDTHGHQAGDEVLRGIAGVLRDCVPEEHLVARYGGEEFAVIFFNRRLEDARRPAEDARAAIGQTRFDVEGIPLRVTTSGGIAQFTAGETTASLVGRADEALYVSKEKGRDCTHLHTGNAIVRFEIDQAHRQQDAAPPPPPQPYDVGISTPEVFSIDVRRRMAQWKSGGAPLCVLFVQIDDLKYIQEHHGEKNSSAVLRALTLTLKAAMREIDHAARFEGNALSLLLPGATLPGAVAVAERIRNAAAQCELPQRHPLRHFTVSVGVAQAREDESEGNLIERVRDSLSVAHMHGQDCTYVHDGCDFVLVGVGSVSMST